MYVCFSIKKRQFRVVLENYTLFSSSAPQYAKLLSTQCLCADQCFFPLCSKQYSFSMRFYCPLSFRYSSESLSCCYHTIAQRREEGHKNRLLNATCYLLGTLLKSIPLAFLRSSELGLFEFVSDRLRAIRQEAVQHQLQRFNSKAWASILLLSMRFHLVATRAFPPLRLKNETTTLECSETTSCQLQSLFCPILNDFFMASCLDQLFSVCFPIDLNPKHRETVFFFAKILAEAFCCATLLLLSADIGHSSAVNNLTLLRNVHTFVAGNEGSVQLI